MGASLWSLLAALVAVYLPALAIPGPNFLAVTQASLEVSRRHGVATALGVASGSTLLASLAAAGAGLLLSHAGPAQRVAALLGGAYLVYLARSIWRQSRSAQPAPAAPAAQGPVRASYRRGLLTNLSNPKALVFFSTIFAGLLGAGAPWSVRAAAVATIFCCSMSWHLSLATLFTRASVRAAYARMRRGLLRGTSLLIGGFGLRLVWQAAAGR
ncbi:MAG: LysE family transporter [Betaproteobacteria bacterium]|nr:LysE family transporter [Betaproteobacteria bacterium]MBU6512660.1 LysE family transporter [Betaproteobacteria bacterium]MDE1956098.1 LysE family transporter [Betaproteobacteria bacterium]MDE2153469.1 LysE family transporter [Betaproteobacteria bacterium]MDE2477380.1 LysE family transporter [Betaproteobacteria bacterium]